MSTYYRLTCDKHLEFCDAFAGTGSPLGDSMDTLTSFMWAHRFCNVALVWDGYKEFKLYEPDKKWVKWTKDNVEELTSRGTM